MEEKDQFEEYEINKSEDNAEFLKKMFGLLALGAVFVGVTLLATEEKPIQSEL